jgi:DNA (cytosine-5)-methyltransferase 1
MPVACYSTGMTTNTADSALRKGSLCSGLGTLDEATPGRLQWVAESDGPASSILARDHATVTNLGDITKVMWSERDHGVDLLTSGDPCQSMSSSGLQLSSLDPRFLWPYVMDTITRVRPLTVFLENVQNLVTVPLLKDAPDWRGQRGSTLKLRLDNLQAAGYAAKWMILGACAVGAPHHRHRWFLRAEYVGQDAPAAQRVMASCGAPRTGGRVLLPTPTTADGMGGPGHSGRDGGMNLRTAVTLLPTCTTRDTKGVDMPNREGGAGLPTVAMSLGQDWGKYTEAIRLWEEIMGRPAPCATVNGARGGRRLNPKLAEWMMGHAEGHVTDTLDYRQSLRTLGNGVLALQAATAYDILR